MTRPTDILVRIARKCIETPEGCWEFTGSKTNGGYGRIGLGSAAAGTGLAHRVTYTELIGEVPAGLDLDHLCRNRACCNPWHLDPVPRSVNLRRSPLVGKAAKLRTHCPEGHEYDATNTYVNPEGRRSCRRCSTKEFRDLRAARKGVAA